MQAHSHIIAKLKKNSPAVFCSFYRTKDNLFRFQLYTNLELSHSLKMYLRDVFCQDTLFWKKNISLFLFPCISYLVIRGNIFPTSLRHTKYCVHNKETSIQANFFFKKFRGQ